MECPDLKYVEALEKDSKRLDWLLQHNDATVCNGGPYGSYFVLFMYSGRVTEEAKTQREAIDLAMQQQ